MYGHEVISIKNGDKEVYNIELVKRQYFMRKKMGEVVKEIESYEDAKVLSKMLDTAFHFGMKLAKGENNA